MDPLIQDTFDKSVILKRIPSYSQVDKNLEWLKSTIIADVSTLCFAPSEIFGKKIYEGVGQVVEPYIAYNLMPFLAKNKVSRMDLYLDPSFESKSYLGFLKRRNQNLQLVDDENLSLRRPDILIHSETLKEYYEIKPNSGDGRYAGYKKLIELNQIYSRFRLPYTEGVSFKCPDTIPIGKTYFVISGKKVPVSLSFGLTQDRALLLYDLCITTDWKKVIVEKLLDRLLTAVLDILKNAIRASKDFLNSMLDAIKDAPIGAIIISVVALAIIYFFLSEITIPATAIAAILVFFTDSVKEKQINFV